ncbi:potassium/proton antiporter [Jannaschia seosinensis]|uniref:Potassium/proton antiporter n=1 Tax=Jannaschia seosinensis TaxID=313367 RepID=A0A0M7B5N4_9RHOB|nr:cation:proton antiporter [Jannaschia seosinensis]CUH12161.1 potassium/proton antiporter [Jannaschia seosinensis]
MHQINIALAVATCVIVLVGLVSSRIESLPISKPLLAVGVGIAVGPEMLRWLVPENWPDAHAILEAAARFTLAISVFGVALRTPKEDYRRLLRPVGLLLTGGMLVMWLTSAGLAWAILGISPLLALLLGAIVTPTDPVVASSIVTGGLAERSLPDRLRSTLSLESGANDGLAYVIVLLPILLLDNTASSAAWERWVWEVLIIGVLVAILIGAIIGCLVAKALHQANMMDWVEEHSLLGLTVALSLFVVTAAKLLGSDGILAAFAAGAAFNLTIDRSAAYEEQNVQEAIGKLFNLPVFVLFGAMLPWREWIGLGWPLLAFAFAVLFLRRPAAILLTGRGFGGAFKLRDAIFLGWFAPVGVAAIYYAKLAEERTHDPLYWHAASLVILASILSHGITSAAGLASYRRASG